MFFYVYILSINSCYDLKTLSMNAFNIPVDGISAGVLNAPKKWSKLATHAQ